jgi:hypothetical protein
MALKAQNQCRMSLETLATIKKPPVVFARQANINNGGQQQVNNGAALPDQTGNVERVEAPRSGSRLLTPVDDPSPVLAPAAADDPSGRSPRR